MCIGALLDQCGLLQLNSQVCSLRPLASIELMKIRMENRSVQWPNFGKIWTFEGKNTTENKEMGLCISTSIYTSSTLARLTVISLFPSSVCV